MLGVVAVPPDEMRGGSPDSCPDATKSTAAIVADQPYQLLPPLPADEYAALRADIQANGIRVPIDVDEHGQILDGHHRQRIAAELAIPCPARLVGGLTEDDKRSHAVAVNVHRRTLTVSQRRDLVLAELVRDPSRSDRAIGRLCGVDGKTVAAARLRNSATEENGPGDLTYEEARQLTDELAANMNAIDTRTARLVAAGRGLDAVRILTTGLDALLAEATDAEMESAFRIIFEPRIRAVLACAA